MERNLKDKVVMITGSSSGIGKSTAFLFSQEGARLILTYNTNQEAGQEVADRCLQFGAASADLVQLDVRSEESVNNAVNEVVSKFKRIDILINNAGIAIWENLEDQKMEEIKNQIETNLQGLIVATQVSLPHIKEVLINIGSGAAKTGFGGLSVYCATKFGVRGFTQSIAQEKTDLDIYIVNPGMTATPLTGFRGDPPDKVARVILDVAKGVYGEGHGQDVDIT